MQTFLKDSGPSFPLYKVLLCQSVLDTNRIKTRQKDLMPGNGRRLAITLVRYLGTGAEHTFMSCQHLPHFFLVFS